MPCFSSKTFQIGRSFLLKKHFPPLLCSAWKLGEKKDKLNSFVLLLCVIISAFLNRQRWLSFSFPFFGGGVGLVGCGGGGGESGRGEKCRFFFIILFYDHRSFYACLIYMQSRLLTLVLVNIVKILGLPEGLIFFLRISLPIQFNPADWPCCRSHQPRKGLLCWNTEIFVKIEESP